MLFRVFRCSEAAHFLFAFDKELHVDWKPAVFLVVFQKRKSVHQLALVVGDSASVEESVLFCYLERFRLPFIERFCRLDVIVVVEENRLVLVLSLEGSEDNWIVLTEVSPLLNFLCPKISECVRNPCGRLWKFTFLGRN